MTKLLDKLQKQTDRSAQFKTVIALNINGQQHLFTGLAKGEITFEPKGDKGFGYDPVFRPVGFDLTFAEISPEEKNRISHRGKATRQLIDFLKN